MEGSEGLREAMRDKAAGDYAEGRMSEEELEDAFDRIAGVGSPEEARARGLGRFLPAPAPDRRLPAPLPPRSVFSFIGDQSHSLMGEEAGLSVTTFLGDVKLDCLHATDPDIRIEVTNLLGDIILRVPFDCRVENRMFTVLGDFQDKEFRSELVDPSKRLTITGFHLLGDIKVKRS